MDQRTDEIDPHSTGINEQQRQQIQREYGSVPVYEIVVRGVGYVNGFGKFMRKNKE